MTCGKPCACPSYRDHLLTISVSADATPSRRPEAAAKNRQEEGWAKDMPAYKRLRADGIQPKRIEGSHDIERSS